MSKSQILKIFFKIFGKDLDNFKLNFSWGTTLDSFFYRALAYQDNAKTAGWGKVEKNYYEFGVGWDSFIIYKGSQGIL